FLACFQKLDDAEKEKHVFHTIESIKSTYKVNKVWTGDPFSQRLPWESISNYQINSMNLKEDNLTGFVPRSLRKRTMASGLALRELMLKENECIQELIQDHFCLREREGSHVALKTTSKVIGKGGF
ncbi:predicted protein, partial [Arabidopsis lyrata subsp. lyrata]